MLHPELVKYLKEMRDNGFSEERARKRLHEAGWDERLVEEAMAAPQKNTPLRPLNSPTSYHEFVDHYKGLFTSPAEFVEKTISVEGYWPLIKDVGIIYAVMSVITMIISIPQEIGQGGTSLLIMIFAIPFAILTVFLMISVALYVLGGIYHLGVLIVGGKGGYKSTFKAVAYAMIISSAYSLISAILLSIVGLVEPQGGVLSSMQVFTGEALTPAPISAFVSTMIGLVSFIHSMVVLVIAVSRYHEMSKTRALVGVLFIPLTIFFILAMLVGVAVAAFLGSLAGVF